MTAEERQQGDVARAMERLHEAQRIGQIGDWSFDVVGGTISWSPQVYEITGRDIALGPPTSYDEMASIFEPDSKGALRRHVDRAIETGQPQSYDLLLARPDGTRVHVTARAVARRDEHGHVVALTGTIQDVTARDRAARLLAESEQRLGFALDAAEIGDWDMDLRTNVARRSLRHDHCFGYREPVAEWGYDTFLAHVDAIDRERVDECFQVAMSGGGEYDVEFRVTWPDGSVHWLWSKGRFFFDDTGRPYRVAGIQVDVTDRRREVEAALRLAAIIESSEDAIISQDRSGVVASWNPGAERLFGCPAAAMIGRRLDHLAGPGTSDDDRHSFDRAARGEAVAPFEAQRRRGDGTYLDVMLTHSPLRDVDGKVVGVSTIATDNSARKEVERTRKLHSDLLISRLAQEAEAVARLRELDRLKDELVANVSHELRTPLASILGYIELLKEGENGALNAQQQTWTEALDRNGARLLAVVENLLTASTIEAGKTHFGAAPVDLNEVVSSAEGGMKSWIDGRRLTTHFHLADSPVFVRGDVGQLEQVVWNLVSNAVKFTDDGGTVECALDTEGHRARLTVSDDGIGIPAAEQAGLFSRFFRASTATDRAIPGSGLGLHVTSSIVKHHGGDISVDSTPGRGTRVTVHLPMAAPTQG